MYDELLEKEIIPSIERESEQELSVGEIRTIVKKSDDTIEAYTQKIDKSDIVSERKQLRSERKEPKKYRKQFEDFLIRKSKYQRDREIFGNRNSYSKTDNDATFMQKNKPSPNGNSFPSTYAYFVLPHSAPK